MEYTPEMLAMLEAQRQHFASDDHIRREVEAWRDATPEERLAAVAEVRCGRLLPVAARSRHPGARPAACSIA